MARASPTPLVHLELHTGDAGAACALYAALCGWRAERVEVGCGSYLALEMGRLGGGIVECPTERPVWLPYVEVDDIGAAIERARLLGACVLLDVREGPAGWRSVIETAAGGELALWQAKHGLGGTAA
jgi:predicted enzyme related to lactoylglutathione lyase